MDQANRPKLLLADDSVTIRKVVELTFADEGIDVTTVGDSATAMSRFVEIQPDIVLVDAGLEGTSGYQICEMIKSDEATRHIPVLLLIGSFEPFDQDEAERVGADGFLTKPFHSIRDLVARVWDLLGRETAVPGAAPDLVDAFVEGHESLEHISTELTAVPASSEDDDIENLYRSSFADTVEIDDYSAIDETLGDSALDDEMIEASYPAGDPAHELDKPIPHPEPAAYTEDLVASTKEFEWSPAAVVAGPTETSISAFEPKFVFEDSPDEPAHATAEIVGEQTDAQSESPKLERIVDEEDLELDAPIATVFTEETDLDSEDHHEILVAYAEAGAVEEEKHVTPVTREPETAAPEPEIWPEVEAASGEPAERQTGAFTAEMLDIIAEKVVSRLSDQIIREIALEAVPRIAEKLIREALSDTRSSEENKEKEARA